MTKKNETSENQAQCAIQNVVCSTWQPTMQLRWLEGEYYIPQLDQMERTLQQKWISNTGEQEWRDIDVYS